MDRTGYDHRTGMYMDRTSFKYCKLLEYRAVIPLGIVALSFLAGALLTGVYAYDAGWRHACKRYGIDEGTV